MTINLEDIEYICCSGGGNRGLMYVGTIYALEVNMNEKWTAQLKKVKGFVGTSAGALFCLCLLLNRSAEEMRKECWEIVTSMRAMAPCLDLNQLLSHYGLDNGETLRDHIGNILDASGLRRDTTLSDLERITNKELICCVTNLRTRSSEYLTPKDHPNIKVTEAVFMSMCIPLTFSPFKYNGDLYVDGFLCENIPNYYPFENTLFFIFDTNKRQVSIDSWSDYIEALFACASASTDFEKKLLKQELRNVVKLTMPTSMQLEFSMKLNLHHAVIQKFIVCGYMCMMHKIYPEFMRTLEGVTQLLIESFVEGKVVSGNDAYEACC